MRTTARILREKGFVKAGTGDYVGRDEIVVEKISSIKSLELPGALKDMERIVISSIISLHKHQSADYSQHSASIKNTLIGQVESATKSKLRNHVLTPILNESTKELRHHASEKIHDAYSYCFHRQEYEARKVQKEKEEKIKQQKIRETEQRMAANDNASQEEAYSQVASGQGGGRSYASDGRSDHLEEKGRKPTPKQYKAPFKDQNKGQNKSKSEEYKTPGKAEYRVSTTDPDTSDSAPTAAVAKQKPFYVVSGGRPEGAEAFPSAATLVKASSNANLKLSVPQEPSRFSASSIMSEFFGIQAAQASAPRPVYSIANMNSAGPAHGAIKNPIYINDNIPYLGHGWGISSSSTPSLSLKGGERTLGEVYVSSSATPSSFISFVPSAQASAGMASSIAASIEIPLLEIGGIYGVRAALALARVNPVVATATGGALLAQGLHNAAQFEAQHTWLGEDFNDIMTNPFISMSIKREMFQKMQSDPLLKGSGNQSLALSSLIPSSYAAPSTIKANDLPQLNPFAGYKGGSTGHKGAGYEATSGHASSNIMLDPRFNRYAVVTPYSEIDPEAGKPQTTISPYPPKPIIIWSTPDDRDKLAELTRARGFTPHPVKLEDLIETRPIHEQTWQDLVLYKDYKLGADSQFDEYIASLQPGSKIDPDKIYYHEAGYHHQNSKGTIKSKAPTDPETALKNAFKIGNTTKKLIGVDLDNKEIVIFRHTSDNEYHGHVADWKGLGEVERNILIKNNLADRKRGLK